MREFRAKIPAFNRRLQCPLQRRFADIQQGKFFSKSFSRKRSEKHLGNWSGIISFVDGENCTEPAKQQRKGKTERQVSLRCASVFIVATLYLFKPAFSLKL